MLEHPPRFAERLLMKIVGGPDAEIIAGDLREEFPSRGALWYWMQVLSCILIRISPHRRVIPDLHRDVHYALRIIRMNPGYAATAMLCLALGVGVNTTVFSWLDEMYFRRLPVPESSRVISIDRVGGPAAKWREYKGFRDDLKAVSGLAAVIPKGTFLDVDLVNDQIYAEVTSANYFDVLRVQAKLGRSFLPSEDSASSDPVVVISDNVWTRHFRSDPNVVGRAVRIEDQWYRIIGVAPAGFRGVSAPLAIDAWVPLTTYPHYKSQVPPADPGVYLIGRLAKSHSLAQASAELEVTGSRLRQSTRRDPRITVRQVTGYNWAEGQRGLRPIATLLGLLVGVILLIACANVANLLLSRAAVRQREMAVRAALGAGRAQLVRQGITEGVVIAMGGAALGLILGFWTNKAIAAMLPSAHPELAQSLIYLDVNWRVAFVTSTLAVLCALLFSISPALECAFIDVMPALKGASNFRGIVRRWRQRDIFVVAQVALSLVLLVSAALLVRTLWEMEGTNPGFPTANRTYIRLFTPDNDFTPQQATSLYGRLLEQARLIPGVRDVTLSFAVFGFMDGDCATSSPSGVARRLNLNVVEPNYFNFMQQPLLRGRSFVSADRPESPRVIVVNETMAKAWWPGEDPIGKRAWLGCKEPHERVPAEVIGVVQDSKYGSLDEQPRPLYFVHWRQVWWNGFFALMVQTAGNPEAMAEPLRTLARSGGSNLRIYEVRTFEDLIALSMVRVKWQARLLAAFSLLAIGLATVGLYGLVAYVLAQRTREIGVRMALGAQAGDVRWMILGHGLRLTSIGIASGLCLSAGITPLLRRFLFGVSPFDASAFVAAASAWLLVSMLASYIPARRATCVDPVVALRYE